MGGGGLGREQPRIRAVEFGCGRRRDGAGDLDDAYTLYISRDYELKKTYIVVAPPIAMGFQGVLVKCLLLLPYLRRFGRTPSIGISIQGIFIILFFSIFNFLLYVFIFFPSFHSFFPFSFFWIFVIRFIFFVLLLYLFYSINFIFYFSDRVIWVI